jgi:Zn finger protein HypA/HybF involved in hydrogenase expression
MNEDKSGYWLKCEDCGDDSAEFRTVTGCNAAAAYIWDTVRETWDRSLLLMKCPKCNHRSLRIT